MPTPSRRRRGFFAAFCVAGLVAGCTAAPASPSGPTIYSGPTVAFVTPTPSPATGSPSPQPSTSASPAPVVREAWPNGQIVDGYALVGPGTGWVRASGGVFETNDNGTSWANVMPPGLTGPQIRGLGAFDSDLAMLATADVDATTTTYTIWRTADGGASWASTDLPDVPHDPNCSSFDCDDASAAASVDPAAYFDFVDPRTVFVWFGLDAGVAGTENHVFETLGGGETWLARTVDIQPPAGGPPGPLRIQFMTPSVGVVEMSYQTSTTTSGWGSWTTQLLPSKDWRLPTITFLQPDQWIADLGLQSGSTSYGYAVSADQGKTWAARTAVMPATNGSNSATVTFLSAADWNATVGLPTTSHDRNFDGMAYTYSSSDGGRTWVLKGQQPFHGSRATWIDSTHGWSGPNPWASTSGAGNGKLYTTTDGGATWRLIAS